MQILVNGEKTSLPEGATAADLVEQLGLAGRRLAMELNGEIIPRSRYPSHTLADGDRVEIVHAIGGG
ncbi:MAG: sulfur carrier protein ThiS [Gammaproteobacteria bacterium]|jgi:sulfur carrier protein